MGKIIATCGHPISIEEMSDCGICIKSQNRDGSPCLDYLCVCPECKKRYEKTKLIVKNPDKYWKRIKRKNAK